MVSPLSASPRVSDSTPVALDRHDDSPEQTPNEASGPACAVLVAPAAAYLAPELALAYTALAGVVAAGVSLALPPMIRTAEALAQGARDLINMAKKKAPTIEEINEATKKYIKELAESDEGHANDASGTEAEVERLRNERNNSQKD